MQRRWLKEQVEQLTDQYIYHLLKRKFKDVAIPQQVIELKRAVILLRRQVREIKNEDK